VEEEREGGCGGGRREEGLVGQGYEFPRWAVAPKYLLLKEAFIDLRKYTAGSRRKEWLLGALDSDCAPRRS
jgi:hypothetical protein